MQKLSERERRMLKEMVALRADQCWLVRGHNRAACSKLVKSGLAERRGSDGYLSEAFSITPAGRALLDTLAEKKP